MSKSHWVQKSATCTQPRSSCSASTCLWIKICFSYISCTLCIYQWYKLLVSQQPACKPSNPHLEAIAPAQQPAPKSLGLWTASWSYERPVDGTCSRKCWWMEAFVAGDVRSSILQHSGPVYAACDVQLVSWTQDIPTVSRHQGNFMLQHVEQVDR